MSKRIRSLGGGDVENVTKVAKLALCHKFLAPVATLALSSPKVAKLALYFSAAFAIGKCGKPSAM